MKIAKRLTSILFASLIAAGCADAGKVTAPDSRAPAAPAFDGVGTAGSGNRGDSTDVESEAAGIGTAGSGNRFEADSSSTTTEVAGIGTAGSGN
jgi:hypothetical protein